MIPAANREKILRELAMEALTKVRTAKATRTVDIKKVKPAREKAGMSGTLPKSQPVQRLVK